MSLSIQYSAPPIYLKNHNKNISFTGINPNKVLDYIDKKANTNPIKPAMPAEYRLFSAACSLGAPGVGQFRKRDYSKGIIMLGSEVALHNIPIPSHLLQGIALGLLSIYCAWDALMK